MNITTICCRSHYQVVTFTSSFLQWHNARRGKQKLAALLTFGVCVNGTLTLAAPPTLLAASHSSTPYAIGSTPYAIGSTFYAIGSTPYAIAAPLTLLQHPLRYWQHPLRYWQHLLRYWQHPLRYCSTPYAIAAPLTLLAAPLTLLAAPLTLLAAPLALSQHPLRYCSTLTRALSIKFLFGGEALNNEYRLYGRARSKREDSFCKERMERYNSYQNTLLSFSNNKSDL